MDLTTLVNRQATWECACGCGGVGGHILSNDVGGRCSSVTVEVDVVTKVMSQHRCSRPAMHSSLVPHGDGETLWGGLGD